MDEKRIAFLMTTLDCTRAEAMDIIAKDAEIDKGGNPFPLTKEKEKASKAMRSAGRRVVDPAGKVQVRERKKNPDKEKLIAEIVTALSSIAKVEIDNVEREIHLFYNDKKYRVVLSEPRK